MKEKKKENLKENPKSVEFRNFRMKDNMLDDYAEMKFGIEFACNTFSEKHLIAKDLYRDEAVIISRAFQQQKILHTVKEECGKYEIRLSRISVIKYKRTKRLIEALQNAIGKITDKDLVIEYGKVNKLIISEDGTLEKTIWKTNSEYKQLGETVWKINSQYETLEEKIWATNPEDDMKIMMKLIEYIQDILK